MPMPINVGFCLSLTLSTNLKGTLGIVWLIITGSLVLADSTNDGNGELEYFSSETDCKVSQSLLTASAEWQAELNYCSKEKIETVHISCWELK